mgnify:CR=1 FL=1
MPDTPWWETTALEDMTSEQWDALCDGCGRCCLIKAWRDDAVIMSKVGCRLLCRKTARCRDYDNRQRRVDNCIRITMSNINTPGLLPDTCAYKRLQRGQKLEWWHHLESGSYDTVHTAGIGVVGKVKFTEDELNLLDLAMLLQESIDDS